MKKTLTLMFVGLLAAATWAQPSTPSSGDGTLPTYEQKPGWVNSGGDATTNPGSNPDNARWNQNGGGRRRGQNGQGHHGKRMARFDTNGDGQLDENEKAAAKAQMMKRFDTDGDGQISDQERQAGRAKMMQRFDTNGDGQISDQERQAARAMRGQGGGGRRHRRNGQFNNQVPFQTPNPSASPSPSTNRGGPLG